MKPYLILDQDSVAESRGVTFAVNPAVRHRENPVLRPGEPHQWDSLQVSWPGTVLYSRRDRKFRCWYAGMDVIQTPDRRWFYGYADSDDGVHWRKPALDQVTFLDRPTNQLKPGWFQWTGDRPNPPWGTYQISTVFENPLPDAPESERFGGYWVELVMGKDGKPRMQKALAWSPDGIHWERACTGYEVPPPYSRIAFHDISQVLNDPDELNPAFRVKAYSQLFHTRAYDGRPNVRHIAFLHGERFERVAAGPDPVALAPETGIDEELHFATVKKIGDIYLMLFESNRFSKNPIRGDLRLAVSRDGRKFRRVHPDTPLLATGATGTWDENMLVTTTGAMQEVGDEVYIYYFGVPSTYNSWPIEYATPPERRGSMFAPAFLGLATLPRDRFACATGAGTLITPPLMIGPGGLWLNAEGDELSVAALDESGKPMAHGKLGAERHQTVYRKLIWTDSPPRTMCCLQVTLRTGDQLFSLLAESNQS